MAKTIVINWLVVLGAFCVGLALTFYLAGREIIRNRVSPSPGNPSSKATGCLLSSLSFIGAFASLGLILSTASFFLGASFTPPIASPASFMTPDHFPSSVTRSGPPSPTPASFFLFPSSSTTPVSTALPPRLQIPSLEIDEPVQTIPIHDGEWDLTDLGTGIGWLTTTGAQPGDELAMVFIGHITVTAKEHGPFAYLQKIQKDAEVIYQAGGIAYTYHVENISRAGPYDVNRLYLADGNSLLLITCTDWDETQRVYASRLVVQARLKD